MPPASSRGPWHNQAKHLITHLGKPSVTMHRIRTAHAQTNGKKYEKMAEQMLLQNNYYNELLNMNQQLSAVDAMAHESAVLNSWCHGDISTVHCDTSRTHPQRWALYPAAWHRDSWPGSRLHIAGRCCSFQVQCHVDFRRETPTKTPINIHDQQFRTMKVTPRITMASHWIQSILGNEWTTRKYHPGLYYQVPMLGSMKP